MNKVAPAPVDDGAVAEPPSEIPNELFPEEPRALEQPEHGNQSDKQEKDGHSSPHNGYRQDIDGLRAVAVIAVLIYHLDTSWMPGGFVGVDVFFVISGYVVTASLLRRSGASIGVWVVDFYARRVKRLSPSLVLVTIVAGLSIALFVPPWDASVKEYYESGMLGLAGGANMYFLYIFKLRNDETGNDGGGYFVPQEKQKHNIQMNPFMHYWSLGIEEQFYLIYPWFLMVIYGKRVVRTLPACSRHVSPLMMLIAAFFVSLVISGWLSNDEDVYAFYLMPSRFWQLIVGALLYELQTRLDSIQVFRQKSTLKIVAVSAVEVLTLGLLVVAFSLTKEKPSFPVAWSFFAVFATCFFIVLGMDICRVQVGGKFSVQLPLLNWILGQRLPVWIGKFSYPLYLWHWPIFVAFKWNSAFDRGEQKMMAICASVMCAILTYHGVEGLVQKWRPRRTLHIFLLFLPTLLVAAAGLISFHGPLHGKLYLEPDEDVVYHSSAVPRPWETNSSNSSSDNGGINRSILDLDALMNNVMNTTTTRTPTNNVMTTTITRSTTYTRTMCQSQSCECAEPGEDGTGLPPCFSDPGPRKQKDCMAYRLTWASSCWDVFAGQGDPGRHWEPCMTPDRGSETSCPKRAVFIVGDSHSASIAHGVEHALSAQYSVVRLGGDCRGFSVQWAQPTPHGSYCYLLHAWQTNFLLTSNKVKRGDVVMLALFHGKYDKYCRDSTMCRFWGRATWLQHAGTLDVDFLTQQMSVVKDLAQGLAARGVSLVLSGDYPFNGCKCLTSAQHHNFKTLLHTATEVCKADEPQVAKLIDAAFAKLAQRIPNIYSQSILSFFCNDGVCNSMIPGTSILWHLDTDHLTNAGSLYLWTTWCRLFKQHGLLD